MPKARKMDDQKVQVDRVFTTKGDGSPLETSKGDPYIRVKVFPGLGERHDGMCSVFDENFFETFKKDNWYQITYTQNGQYYNIVDAVPCEAETYDKHDAKEKGREEQKPDKQDKGHNVPPPAPSRPIEYQKSKRPEEAKSIVTQAIMKSVIEAGGHMLADGDGSPKAFISWARKVSTDLLNLYDELMDRE